MSEQFVIAPAVKAQKRARISITGPSGSGKTYTALSIAAGLAPEGRPVVIDTENGSASMYANEFAFDVLPLASFSPETYIAAIQFCEQQGYGCIIIDSLSHAWMGKDGALEQVDKAAAREKGNSFGAWRHVTPMQTRMVDAILASRAHIIVTMRSKTEYVIEEHNGKKAPRKVGMAPVQRDGIEYEFDVNAEMDQDHKFVIGKTRIRALDGEVIEKPGADLGARIRADLMDGTAPAPQPQAAGSSQRLETPADDIANAQYHPDGRPANAPAERHAQTYTLAPAAEQVLLTLMDALELPDDERATAWASVTSRENAQALKADLEHRLQQKAEAVA